MKDERKSGETTTKGTKADRRFYGQTYAWCNPDGSYSEIGVVTGLGGVYIVGWISESGGHHRVKSPRFEPCSDARAMQHILDDEAQKRELRTWAEHLAGAAAPEAAPEALPAKRGPGRPPNVLKLCGEMPLEKRVETIRELFHCAQTRIAQGGIYLLQVGLQLHVAHAQVGDGNWITWIEANCPFSRVSAWRWMKAAEMKYREMADVSHTKHALPADPKDLTPDERDQIIKLFGESCKDQTGRQLLLSLGLETPRASEKSATQPAAADPAAEPPRELTVEEKYELRRKCAFEDWQLIEKDLCVWFRKKHYGHLSDSQIRAVRQTLQGALALLPKVS